MESASAALGHALPTSTIDQDSAHLQLSLLRGDAQFEPLQVKVRAIAALLEEQVAIPSIAKQMPLLLEIQTDQSWVDASLVSLEDVRRKFRGLVGLIEKEKRRTIITDIGDEIGEGTLVNLPGFTAGVDPEKVREKALLFLRKHENDPAIHKFKWNEPLTPEDLQALEITFAKEGSSPEEIDLARREGGLGLFVRSLIGLDREAAKKALSSFTLGRNLTANQIEFINLIINHLTVRGWMDPAHLYTSPFIDEYPSRIEGVFDDPLVSQLVSLLSSIKQNAMTAGA